MKTSFIPMGVASDKKILVRTPNWIGDHVMAHPFYCALKKAYPAAEVQFLCSEPLRGFKDEAFCSKKIVLPSLAKRLSKEFLATVEELRSEKFDLAISLTASFSSSFLLWMARIPIRIGFSQGGSEILLTDSLRWRGRSAGIHKSEIYLELLSFMTGKVWKPELLSKPKVENRRRRLIVAPGASIELRVWPYFRELIHQLSNQYGEYEISVVGGRGEGHWHSLLKDLRLKNVVDRIEQTTLPELIELCRESQVVIANDSGVAHLSATLAEASTVVLFGPGDPDYIQPLGPKVHGAVPQSIPCHPCEKPYCHEKYGYQACLKAIPVEKILAEVNSIITH